MNARPSANVISLCGRRCEIEPKTQRERFDALTRDPAAPAVIAKCLQDGHTMRAISREWRIPQRKLSTWFGSKVYEMVAALQPAPDPRFLI